MGGGEEGGVYNVGDYEDYGRDREGGVGVGGGSRTEGC